MKETLLAPSGAAAASAERATPAPRDTTGPPTGARAQFSNLGQLLGSQAVVAVAAVASLPVLARNLGPEAYGRFSLFVMSLGLLAQLDLSRPILVRELSRSNNGGAVAATLSTSSGLLLAVLGALVGLFVGGPLTASVLAIALLLHALASAPFARLSGEGRVGRAGAVRNACWAAALVAVTAASFATRSPHAWVWPFLAANTVILAVYLWLSPAPGGQVLGRPVPATLRRYRRDGADVVGFAAASVVVSSSDRLVLEAHASQAAFGHYAAQYDLATKVNVVSTSIGSVLYPTCSRQFAEQGYERAAASFVRLSSRIAVGYFLVLGLMIAGHDALLRLVFGASFAATMDGDVYALMLVGVFIHLFGFLLTPFQRACGDFRSQRIAYLASAALMLVVGLVTIPRYGPAGAVASYLTGRLAEVALIVVEVRRMPRAALPRWRVVALVGMFAALAAAAVLAQTGHLPALGGRA